MERMARDRVQIASVRIKGSGVLREENKLLATVLSVVLTACLAISAGPRAS